MLYERWRGIARARRTERALTDLQSGRHWTFGELLDLSDGLDQPDRAMVYPRGNNSEFVVEVLRGWRHERVVCPLEHGALAPVLPSPPSGVVHLKTTSASTKAARCVAFRAEQLAADPEQIVRTMQLRPDWPNLGLISLAHSYGFSSLVLPLLLHGIPLILAESGMPDAVRRALRGGSDVTLPAVPVLWRAWHDAGVSLASVRLAISAGAPLPLGLEQGLFHKAGLKVHNFYGASECGGIAYDIGEDPREDAAFVGRPMLGAELSLQGNGCLQVRGPSVGECYWPEFDDQLQAGRFRTSDLAELGATGVRLCGRVGDLIHVAGRKVAPEAIESVLGEHPAVQECLVLGLPESGGVRGDCIVAVVVAEEGQREALREFLLQRLPAWQVPRRWVFQSRSLSNLRGKVSRADWQARVQAGEGVD